MLLFIIIFFAMLIVVGVSAVVGFSVYLKRRAKSLESDNQKQFDDAPPYRSLFAATNDEIRALECEENEEIRAKKLAQESLAITEKIERAVEFEKIWRASPDRQKTIELFRLAAATEKAKIFSEIAESVINVWRGKQIEDLTAGNLADLLDSHFRTLPQQERFSGALFLLKQEITDLRGKSEEDF